jgi:D-amino-acid dehydrogenase
MKVLVIGSGLIGTTTAYNLALRGCDVTVLDRRNGAGLETSFANGALLTPSMSEPWNSPDSWRVLLSSLVSSDAPLQVRWKALPSLAGWGVNFLKNARPSIFARHTLANIQLAVFSLAEMDNLRQRLNIEFDHAALGTLRLFRSKDALEAKRSMAFQHAPNGITCRYLSIEELVHLEPALMPIAKQLFGALHYDIDQVGDAYKFCSGLALRAQEMGVRFCYNTNVRSLQIRDGRIVSISSDNGELSADTYVVAAGSYSGPLLRSANIRIPVRPAKGYSVTLKRSLPKMGLKIPIADDQLHAVVVPLGSTIRVAGTAEFSGYDDHLCGRRVEGLINLVRKVLPEADLDFSSPAAWSGLRPMSVDGVPIIGKTQIPNLFVNTGHGHLGWTMAAGSAHLLADLVTNVAPCIDPEPLSLARFG